MAAPTTAPPPRAQSREQRTDAKKAGGACSPSRAKTQQAIAVTDLNVSRTAHGRSSARPAVGTTPHHARLTVPTYTLEEIKADLNTYPYPTEKLNLALERVHPPHSPYAQNLSQLTSEISKALVDALPDRKLASSVDPSTISIHLCDKPGFNAFVLPTPHGPFSIFIHRELIDELLKAPELKQDNMVIDAFAAIVAHELSHTFFKRNISPGGNSMAQEGYCDLLPAQMLGRAGFRLEAMAKVHDIMARLSGKDHYESVDLREPHPSVAIRRESYEKGAFEEYQRARKAHASGQGQDITAEREAWESRLSDVHKESANVQVSSFLKHALTQRGYEALPLAEKLDLIGTLLTENRELLKRKDCAGELVWLSREMTTLVEESAQKAHPLPTGSFQSMSTATDPDSPYSAHKRGFQQHPTFDALSAALVKSEYRGTTTLQDEYERVAKVLGTKHFGIFTGADEALERFVRATNDTEIRAALGALTPLHEKAYRFDANLNATDPRWGSILFPATKQATSEAIPKDELQRLREGHTIAFPFGPHLTLRDTLLESVRKGDDGATRDFSKLRRELEASGISEIEGELHANDGKGACQRLLIAVGATQYGSRSPLKIDQKDGIQLLHPYREPLEKNSFAALSALIQSESRYAHFIARRGEALLAEASILTKDNIFPFIREHSALIAPQVHPPSILPGNLTRDSQRLAEVVVDRVRELTRSSKNDPTFRTQALNFLTGKEGLAGAANQFYRDYHQSIIEKLPGPRVNPDHPILRYILTNPDGLLGRDEQLVSLSRFHGLAGSNFLQRLRGAELVSTFSSSVGGEANVRELLGIDLTQTPRGFIDGLTRIERDSQNFYQLRHEGLGPSVPVFEARAHFIAQYVNATPHNAFAIQELHELYDLALGCDIPLLRSSIVEKMVALSQSTHLPSLSNDQFVDHYQRMVAVGAADRLPLLAETLNSEVTRRCDACHIPAEKWALTQQFLFPRTFQVGDVILGSEARNAIYQRLGVSVSGFENTTSVYYPRTTTLAFERFIVQSAVEGASDMIRRDTGRTVDDGSAEFSDACKRLTTLFDERMWSPGLRAQILEGIADELVLQRESSYGFRDNLLAHEKRQRRVTFQSTMEALNSDAKDILPTLHNALSELRQHHRGPLRESLFRLLRDQSPAKELPKTTDLLLKEVKDLTESNSLPKLFETLGIHGVTGGMSDVAKRELIEFHLRALHERSSAQDVKARGALLSALAVGHEAPKQAEFDGFVKRELLPRILPAQGKYNNLLETAITEYFSFYKESTHQKYMVACAILASAGEKPVEELSELARVGVVAKSFLGAHGSAGYKLLQRIRNHPDTPGEIKEVLHDVLDSTVKYPRWRVHEMIEKLGPQGATSAWVGSAKAGSMCLSVPLRKEKGDETFVSIIHPGAESDALYWLNNFATLSAELAKQEPKLEMLSPMCRQTEFLIRNETAFDHSPHKQQSVAEAGYTYTMRFPKDDITVVSDCAPLVSAESRHDKDFTKNSGNKEAGRVQGKPFLELIKDFEAASESGTLSRDEALKEFAILKAVASSVLCNEIKLTASGKGKDHDRHPGNYLVEVERPFGKGAVVRIHHFDFGCTDTEDPTPQVRSTLISAVQKGLGSAGVVKMLFNRGAIVDDLNRALFKAGETVPQVGSIPLGLLAASGANEKVSLNGKETPLLSKGDYAKILKAGLSSAEISSEGSKVLPKGLTGFVIKRAFRAIKPDCEYIA